MASRTPACKGLTATSWWRTAASPRRNSLPSFALVSEKYYRNLIGDSLGISPPRNMLEIQFLHENAQQNEPIKSLLQSRVHKVKFSTTLCSDQPAESHQLRDAKGGGKCPLKLGQIFSYIVCDPMNLAMGPFKG